MQLQQEDSDISPVLDYVQQDKRPDHVDIAKLSTASKLILKEWKRLQVFNGVLHRVTQDPKQLEETACATSVSTSGCFS